MSQILKTVEMRDEFKKLLLERRVIIVKASASWCSPCKEVAPLIKKLFEKMPNNVYLFEFDVDNSPDLATYFKITKLPTLISYFGKDKKDIVTSSKEKDLKVFFNKVDAHCGMEDLSVHLYGE